MMELTRAFGQLVKNGMRPRRTLVVCSWDGEEVGLTGSTEWGEQFADELRSKAVAYINVDEATSGPDFHGQAVASLAPMLEEATRSLEDPSGKSLYDAWKATVERENGGQKSSQFSSSGVVSESLPTPGSAAAPITPSSSTSSACPCSGWGSRETTASITPPMTTSSG